LIARYWKWYSWRCELIRHCPRTRFLSYISIASISEAVCTELKHAARGYFGKSAKDLSIGESAMLAGLLKSPNNLSPWHSQEAAVNERDFVLGRMVENRKITEEQAKEEVK